MENVSLQVLVFRTFISKMAGILSNNHNTNVTLVFLRIKFVCFKPVSITDF